MVSYQTSIEFYFNHNNYKKRGNVETYCNKIKEARESEELTATYKSLRYFIRFDGTVENYALNNSCFDIRRERVLFLDEEITKHPIDRQEYIDTECSKKKKRVQRH